MTRSLLLASASATVLAILAASIWVDQTHLTMSECLDQEAKDYPRLEQVANELMGSVGEQIRRVSFCEDAVEPGASVRVSVYDWTTRTEARRYLRNAGIAVPHGESALTYQGVHIQHVKSVDHLQNSGAPYVEVWFTIMSK